MASQIIDRIIGFPRFIFNARDSKFHFSLAPYFLVGVKGRGELYHEGMRSFLYLVVYSNGCSNKFSVEECKTLALHFIISHGMGGNDRVEIRDDLNMW